MHKKEEINGLLCYDVFFTMGEYLIEYNTVIGMKNMWKLQDVMNNSIQIKCILYLRIESTIVSQMNVFKKYEI